MIQKIQRTKLHEVVVKQVVELISIGMYKNGDKLPSEKQLCELYGVSRVTMREALKQLSELGFIETRQGLGSIVCVDADDLRISAQITSSIHEMKNTFDCTMQARLLLEPMLAYTIASTASDEDLKTLEEKIRMDNNNNQNDPSSVSLENFHIYLSETLHNPLIADFLSQLRTLENDAPQQLPSLPDKHINFRTENYRQHQLIMNSILSRQPDMAYLHMKEHILYLSGQFNRYFDSVD